MPNRSITPRSWSWQSVGDRGLSLLLFGAITAVVMWVRPLTPVASRQENSRKNENFAGGSIAVHAEVLHIWLPEQYFDLAAFQALDSWPRDHQELKGILENAGCEDLCYALCLRVDQSNSDPVNVVFIREPYREPWRFKEFLEILSTAFGSPPRDGETDYSTAEVLLMPAGTSKRELLSSRGALSHSVVTGPRSCHRPNRKR